LRIGVFNMRRFSIKPFLTLILVLIATLNRIPPIEGWTSWKYNTGNVVSSVTVSSSGNYTVAGTENGDLFLLNKQGTLIWSKSLGNEVEGVSISSDGNRILVGVAEYSTGEPDVFLFDKNGSTIWGKNLIDSGRPCGVSISGNGNYIATGDTDNKVRFFNSSGDQLWAKELGNWAASVSVSSAGDYIAAGSWDGNVYFFNQSGGELWSYDTQYSVYGVSTSPEGGYVASVGSDIFFFDGNGHQLWNITSYFGEDISVSANGNYIAAGEKYDDKITLLNKAGGELWSWDVDSSVNSVAVTTDGKFVVGGADDGYVYFLENLPPSTITCGRSKSQVFVGESITISGSIDPLHGGVEVVLTYTRPNTTILQRNVTTSGDGSYSDTLAPDQAGLWRVRASWGGDADNMGAVSSTVKFIVSTVREIALKIGENKTLSECFEPPGSYSKPIGGEIVYSESIEKSDYLSFKTESVVITFSGILNNILDKVNITYTLDVLEIAPEGVYTANATYTFKEIFLGSPTTLFTYEIRLSIEASTLKIPTDISCAVSPIPVPLGETVTVSGVITPTCGGVQVTLNYTKPDFTIITSTVMTDVNGTYMEDFIPDSVGVWWVKASWDGDENHLGAESQKFMFRVVKASSSIFCSPSPTQVVLGFSIDIQGSLTPPLSGVNITMTYTKPNAVTFTRTATTASDGTFGDTCTPDLVGSWGVAVSWPGNENYEECEYSTSFEVVKASSSIYCSASPTQIVFGASINVQGTLSPSLGGANVTLTYTKPDKITFTRTVTTASNGTFTDTYFPDAVGSWTVVASWPGNKKYEDCEYSTSFTVVEPTGSIIDFLLRPDVLGVLLAVVSLTGGGFAWFMGKRKRGRVKTFLDEIDGVYSRFKMNSRRCEAELLRLRERSLDMLKRGKIDESNYGLLKERIDEYLREIREEIEREG
jgi:hypothetical protein